MSKTTTQLPCGSAYTLKEAAAFLKVDQRTVQRWIQRKLLRKSKAIRGVRIPAADVETFYERTSS